MLELTIAGDEHDSEMSEQAQLRTQLTQFMEAEARSCSMDPGCITPLYIYRMWGGKVELEVIEHGLKELVSI